MSLPPRRHRPRGPHRRTADMSRGMVATMAKADGVFTARTLGNSHPTLLDLLRPGMSVLDVGCGPGTLTAEIARRVAPGAVVGMDVNPAMVSAAEAAHPPDRVPNLVFYAGDIQRSGWETEFDLATATRMLQWIPDPDVAVAGMARAVLPGGLVVLLDLDHERARWAGAPEAWTRFYSAFLGWRAAAGFDNAIARRLASLAERAGLVDVTALSRTATTRTGSPGFYRAAGIWRMIIETRGRQMVAAGHLTEVERRAALRAYTAWMTHARAVQHLHEICVVARRPRGRARRRRAVEPESDPVTLRRGYAG